MVRQEGYVLNDFAAFWTNTLQECSRVQKQSKMRDTFSAHGVAKLSGNKQSATTNAPVKTKAVGKASSQAMKSAQNPAMRRARNGQGDAGKVHDDGFPQWMRDMDVAVTSVGKPAQYDFEDFAGCWDSLCSMKKSAASKGSSTKTQQLSKSSSRSGDQALAHVGNAKQGSRNHGNHGATNNGSGNQSAPTVAPSTLAPSNAKGKRSNNSSGADRVAGSEGTVSQSSMQPRHQGKADNAQNLTADKASSSANQSHNFGKAAAAASAMLNSSGHSHGSGNQGRASEANLRLLLASSPKASPLHIKQGPSIQMWNDCAQPEDERSIIRSGLASYDRMMVHENAATLKDLASAIVQIYGFSNNGRDARAVDCNLSETIQRLSDYVLAAGNFPVDSATVGKTVASRVDQATAVNVVSALPGHAARVPGKQSVASGETYFDPQRESSRVVGCSFWIVAMHGSVNVGKGGAGGVEMLDRRFDEGSSVINVGVRKYSMFHKP